MQAQPQAQGYQQSSMGRTPEDTPAHDEHNKGTMGKLMDKIKQPFEKKKHDKDMQQTDNTGLGGATTGVTPAAVGTGATGQSRPEGVQVNPGDTVVITGVAVTGGVIPYTVNQQSGLGNTDDSTLPQIQEQSTTPAMGADTTSTDKYRSTGAVDTPATGFDNNNTSGYENTNPAAAYDNTPAASYMTGAGYDNTPSAGYDNTSTGFDNTSTGTPGYAAGGYSQDSSAAKQPSTGFTAGEGAALGAGAAGLGGLAAYEYNKLQDPTPVAAQQLGLSSGAGATGSPATTDAVGTDSLSRNTDAYDNNTTGMQPTGATGYDNMSSTPGATGTRDPTDTTATTAGEQPKQQGVLGKIIQAVTYPIAPVWDRNAGADDPFQSAWGQRGAAAQPPSAATTAAAAFNGQGYTGTGAAAPGATTGQGYTGAGTPATTGAGMGAPGAAGVDTTGMSAKEAKAAEKEHKKELKQEKKAEKEAIKEQKKEEKKAHKHAKEDDAVGESDKPAVLEGNAGVGTGNTGYSPIGGGIINPPATLTQGSTDGATGAGPTGGTSAPGVAATSTGATGMAPTGMNTAGASSTPGYSAGHPTTQDYNAGQNLNTGEVGLSNVAVAKQPAGQTFSMGQTGISNIGQQPTGATGYDNNNTSAYGNTGVTGYNNTDTTIPPSSGYGQTGSAGVGNVANVAGPIPGYTENKAGGAGYTDPVTGRVRDAGGYDGTGTVPWTNPRINPYGVDPNDADPYMGVDTTGKTGTDNTGSGNTQSKGVIGKIADKLKGSKDKNNTDVAPTTDTGATGYNQFATPAAYDTTSVGYGNTGNIGAVDRTPVQEVDTIPNVFENKPFDNAVDTCGTTGNTGATGFDNTPSAGYDNNMSSGYGATGTDSYDQNNNSSKQGGAGQMLKEAVTHAAQGVQSSAQGVQNKMKYGDSAVGAPVGDNTTSGFGNTANAFDFGNTNKASGFGSTAAVDSTPIQEIDNTQNIFERNPYERAGDARGTTDSFGATPTAGGNALGYNRDPAGWTQGSATDSALQGNNNTASGFASSGFDNTGAQATPGQKLAARTPEDIAMTGAQQQRY